MGNRSKLLLFDPDKKMSHTAPLFEDTRPLDLICMGRVAVDLYAEQVYSHLKDAQSFRKYLGGCAGNTAVGTARLGLKSAMFSCVGTDEMGLFLRDTLENEGVDTTLLRSTPEHLTALVVLGVNPPDRFPLIFYRENCADMQIQPEDVNPEMFRKAKALLITGTGLSTSSMREATWKAVKTAKESGCAVILDIDYRPVLWGLTEAGDGETRFVASAAVTREIQPFLSDLDLIVGTEEEIMIAGGEQTLEKSLSAIGSQSSATVVLKRGAEGCMVYSADSPSPVSARSFKIEVLNVLGAGDSFMSGFLRGWLRNESLENCALYGNACGALVVTRHGCSPSSPSFDEVEHFIRNFDKVPNLAHHPKMNHLHSRTEFGQQRNRGLLILAFDHRNLFEESCLTGNLPQEKIFRFKELVHQGFHSVSQTIKDNNLAILIDPKYGKKILNDSSDFNYTVGVPVEDEGIFPLNWLCEGSLYQHLLERPSTWFVKVLFRFHTKMNPEDKKSQLTQLRKLSGVCSELKRKLMVELIIPEDFSQEDASTVNEVALTEAIDEVYKEGIYPYWWKINALDSKEKWVKLNEVMDENDPEAGVIFQYNYSQIEKLGTWFGAARSNSQSCGLAVGQSIFWEPWEKYINGNADDAEVISEVAERFQKLLKVWSDL